MTKTRGKSMKYLVASALAALLFVPMTSETASAHGCHRDAEYGRAGLHYHSGRDCDRIEGRRRSYREREYRERDYGDRDRRGAPQCVKKCQYIGPIKTCDTICR
jgi:hypothetical protein